MKIFADFSKWNQTGVRNDCGWIAWPDSCVLLSNRPLFVPDFDKGFYAVPALAVRIGRIGKNIAERFAERYVGNISPALIILPETAIECLLRGEMPLPAMTCFDSSIVIGEPADGSDVPTGSFDVRMDIFKQDRDETIDRRMRFSADQLTEAIVSFSKRNTVKNGDMVLALNPDFRQKIREGDVIRLYFPSDSSSRPTLETRFK